MILIDDDIVVIVVDLRMGISPDQSKGHVHGDSASDIKPTSKSGFSEMNEVSFDLRETSHGTRLLVVRETGADMDFLDFYTIYLGHEVELRLAPGKGAADPTLTEEQIQKCISFLSDLEFTPIG